MNCIHLFSVYIRSGMKYWEGHASSTQMKVLKRYISHSLSFFLDDYVLRAEEDEESIKGNEKKDISDLVTL